MELNVFIEQIAEQLVTTDPSEIKADTDIRNLEEWSSLIALSIVAMIDEEYDVTIKGDDIKDVKTVEDLFNVVKAKAEAK